MTTEFDARAWRGAFVLTAGITAFLAAAAAFGTGVYRINHSDPGHVFWGWIIVACVLAVIIDVILMTGLTVVQPNTARVVVLFGSYTGTIRSPGFWWVNPFSRRHAISFRTRNMVTPSIKVNDVKGNPIEIGAVVVWRVVDAARAMFDVDNFKSFVDTQCESALRHLASVYPYDSSADHEKSLRGSTDEVSRTLAGEVQDRVAVAGVTIEEARLSHLAYAPEIAGAMLRRQQADAVVAARFRIVEGAVGMVELALEHLEKGGKVSLDDERKAAMVSNLMVVLCGEHGAQAVVNTGTLYST